MVSRAPLEWGAILGASGRARIDREFRDHPELDQNWLKGFHDAKHVLCAFFFGFPHVFFGTHVIMIGLCRCHDANNSIFLWKSCLGQAGDSGNHIVSSRDR